MKGNRRAIRQTPESALSTPMELRRAQESQSITSTRQIDSESVYLMLLPSHSGAIISQKISKADILIKRA